MGGEPVGIAIVGAGPAGCLMAASLLQAAKVRRREVHVRLYGTGPLWGPDRPLVLDDASLACLAATGVPLPAGTRVQTMLTLLGSERISVPRTLHVLQRNRLVTLLRAALSAQGVSVVEKKVTQMGPALEGGWMVRADGASHRVDWVVLACGAGAPVAAQVPGHRPPPAWESCVAELPFPPRRTGTALHAPPMGAETGDLWTLPFREGAWTIFSDASVSTGRFAGRLLTSALQSGCTDDWVPSNLATFRVPSGAAAPAVPTVGSALGGPPEGTSIAEVSRQAALISHALLDGGMEEAVQVAAREARLLASVAGRRRRRRVALRRLPKGAVEIALRRERKRPGLPGPATKAIQGLPLSFLSALRAMFAFLVASLLAIVGRVRPRQEAPGPARSPSEIFIVEDDAAQAEGLAGYLQGRGFSTRTFGDGLRAVMAAKATPPAAIVLDLALPWLDGAETLRFLRTCGLEGVPVIVTSALTHLGKAISTPQVVARLPKPLDLEELVRRLEDFSPPRLPNVRSGIQAVRRRPLT